MNVDIQISLRDVAFNSLGLYPEEKLLDHVVVIFLILGEPATLFSTVASPFYIPTNSATRVPNSLHSHQHLLFSVFLIVAILMRVRWYLIEVWIFIF